jgi:hypothetical protein
VSDNHLANNRSRNISIDSFGQPTCILCVVLDENARAVRKAQLNGLVGNSGITTGLAVSTIVRLNRNGEAVSKDSTLVTVGHFYLSAHKDCDNEKDTNNANNNSNVSHKISIHFDLL